MLLEVGSDGHLSYAAEDLSPGVGSAGGIELKKTTKSGDIVWETLDLDRFANVRDVAFDPSENSIIVFAVTWSEDDPVGHYEVRKYDSDGNKSWTVIKPFYTGGGATSYHLGGLSVDAGGHVILTGGFDHGHIGGYDRGTSVKKFDAAGAELWSHQCVLATGVPGSGIDPGSWIDSTRAATDAAGDINVIGRHHHAYVYFPDPPGARFSSIFVQKISSAGLAQWYGLYLTSSYTESLQVARAIVGLDGDRYLAGSVEHDGDPLESAVVLRVDATNGAEVWHDVLGGDSNSYYEDLVSDASGDVYVTGYVVREHVQWNAGADLLVRRYTPTGALVWSAELKDRWVRPAISYHHRNHGMSITVDDDTLWFYNLDYSPYPSSIGQMTFDGVFK